MKTIQQLIKELNFYDLISKLKILFQRFQALVENIITLDQVEQVVNTAVENYVPLAGTTDPITGDLVFDSTIYGGGVYQDFSGIKSGVIFNQDESLRFGFDFDGVSPLGSATFDIQSDRVLVSSDYVDFRGIIGGSLFDKQNNLNAYAQIGDVQNATGFASYTDTAYTAGAPFTALAGVTVALPNNAGIIYDDEKPSDISSFYTAGKITGRDGDGLGIMIYFNATPSIINSELDIWIDIGGAVGVIYKQTIYFRGTTEKGVLYSLPVAYSRATWEANGGTVYIKPSVDMTMYGMNFNIARTSKSNNQ